MVAVRHFHLENSDPSVPDAELLRGFLAQYYLGDLQPADEGLPPAREVLLLAAPEDRELLERTFGVAVRVPETESESRLVKVARTNCRYALEQGRKKGTGHGLAALEEVMDRLQLARLPQRIECYDISNTQGEESVASRVVFVDGSPDKELYRRYRIRTVQGSNDFAMMREVLQRRFSRTDEALPDLVVVDGGKGQLAQASAILEELAIQGVGLVGLAKARTESDFRATEVRSSQERVFIPGRKNPVPLLPHTAAFKLLTHVRDEAHRFAISYHRLLRGKRSLGGGAR
jgi:excinuclease ABC subunit C